MFERPVVFVIGAGASNEYGLPLGKDLKSSIAASVSFRDAKGHDVGDRELIRSLPFSMRAKSINMREQAPI